MNTELPTTIAAYLKQLRAALQGNDPAMIQDALHDAEEYLRAELAAQPGKSEAEVIAAVAGSYGAPEEVAEIYRDTEVKVQAALHGSGQGSAGRYRPDVAAAQAAPATAASPAQRPLYEGGVWRRVFGVFTDPRTYGALFYMLLALATGIFYFTWTVTGASLSLGLAILIIGLPFFLLFVAASRVIALVEGRIVETMLGERMPRRAAYADRDQPLLTQIKAMLLDARTWSALLYFVLMLPLGIVYFTLAVTGLSVSVALIVSPVLRWAGANVVVNLAPGSNLLADAAWAAPMLLLAGVAVLLLTLHGARLIGRAHGKLAKALLVEG